jgi:hypothetical protein
VLRTVLLDSDKDSAEIGRLEVVEIERRRRWSFDEKPQDRAGEPVGAAANIGDGAAMRRFAFITPQMASVGSSRAKRR